MSTYHGFSTVNFLKNKSFVKSDEDIIIRDFLNYIYTIPGERVHMPDYGTEIPLLAFKPLDQITLEIIEKQLKKAIAFDPRIELVSFALMPLPNQYMVIVLVDIRFITLNTTKTINIEITQSN